MKKLKQMSGPYSIGFELSSTAHGFVATDPHGNVLYHGKQPVMGTRVFKEGQHAAEARMPRTFRRGIQRRRGREHEMERVFALVISPIDPDFFIRRRMSYKLGKIRFESDPIGFSYSCLFHSFPTLAHLDVALMESDSAMDPRLIFEAVANHVVRRGHFLLENQMFRLRTLTSIRRLQTTRKFLCPILRTLLTSGLSRHWKLLTSMEM